MKITFNALINALIATSLLLASTASADCPQGQNEVTIVNPGNGPVVELCVPDAALPGLLRASENSGQIIILAFCPCFSQEDVEAAGVSCEEDPGMTTISGEPCTLMRCDTITAAEGPSDFDSEGFCGFESGVFATGDPNLCDDGSATVHVTEEEADACVAILQTFDES